jgi:hypothetical protein
VTIKPAKMGPIILAILKDIDCIAMAEVKIFSGTISVIKACLAGISKEAVTPRIKEAIATCHIVTKLRWIINPKNKAGKREKSE